MNVLKKVEDGAEPSEKLLASQLEQAGLLTQTGKLDKKWMLTPTGSLYLTIFKDAGRQIKTFIESIEESAREADISYNSG